MSLTGLHNRTALAALDSDLYAGCWEDGVASHQSPFLGDKECLKTFCKADKSPNNKEPQVPQFCSEVRSRVAQCRYVPHNTSKYSRVAEGRMSLWVGDKTKEPRYTMLLLAAPISVVQFVEVHHTAHNSTDP